MIPAGSPRRQSSFSNSCSALAVLADATTVSGERERRLGQTPAAFGAHVGIDLGVLEVLDGAGASELVDVGGDPQQHPPNAIEIDHNIAAVGMIGVRAQVDHRRVLADFELLKPAGAVAQPLDLIAQPIGDHLAAGEFLIATALRVLQRRPAIERAQLVQGRVETVELGVADDRVDTGRAEPGRRRDLPDRDALGVRAGAQSRSSK